MSRLRRLRRWWPVLVVVFLALFVYSAWPGRWTFTVSPETTYVTGPRDAQGYVDYPAALNERLRDGITPAQNANVLILQALGPRPEGGTMPPEYYQWLGIEEPPEQGEYFLGSYRYFAAHLKDQPEEMPAEPPDELPDEPPVRPDRSQQWNDQLDRARQWPWKTKDHPDVADWLQRNEKPLAVMIEASKRPRYYNPLVSKGAGPGEPRLIISLLPTVQKCRDVGTALTCRAMARVADGDLDGAWQDLLACQRLGRLIATKGTLIESLVGFAIVSIATNAELTLLSHSKASSKQVLAWLEDLRKLPPMTPVADKVDLTERFATLDILMSVALSGPQALSALEAAPGGPKPPGNLLLDRLFTRSIDFDPAFRNANRMFDRCVAAGRLPDRQARQAAFAAIVGDLKDLKAEVSGTGLLERAVAGKAKRGERIGDIVIALMLPAFEKLHDAADRTEQIQINLHVAFALAAYRADAGRYPARLDELVPKYLPTVPGDLFSGKPLVYRPQKDGYLLYSVGVNGQDEDGRWVDDEPRGDDPRVRMPVPEPKDKPKPAPAPRVPLPILAALRRRTRRPASRGCRSRHRTQPTGRHGPPATAPRSASAAG